jgi:hypothetical protein
MGDVYDEMDMNELLTLEGVVASFKPDGASWEADVRVRDVWCVRRGASPEAALRAAVQAAGDKRRTEDLVRAHSAACLLLELLEDLVPSDGVRQMSRLAAGVSLPDLIRWLRDELGDDTPLETPAEFDPVTVAGSYVNTLFAADNGMPGNLNGALEALQGLLRS